jgi:ketosteroid isomerase-like protein
VFERYTEKARRVIFFARYEASEYGSAYIETQHLLLGLLREAPETIKFLGPNSIAADIRSEIEALIPPRERIAISVEVPLTDESKKILKLAWEEAQRLGHQWVGPEHLLLGILRVEGSLGARLLRNRGVKAAAVREELAKLPPTSGIFAGARAVARVANFTAKPPSKPATTTLDSFLAGLRLRSWDKLPAFLAQNVQFVDSIGKRWQGREEIEKQFDALFAPYAKKNTRFILEGTSTGPGDCFVASILWQDVVVGAEATKSMHRMTLILVPEGDDWAIVLLQVTPVVIR